METKHVKGNWKHDEYSVFAENTTEFIEGNIVCLAPEHATESMKYWEANAKLISTAPELLEALNNLCEWVKVVIEGNPLADLDKITQYTKAKELINKATK